MLAAVAFVPSPPLLLRALGGSAAAELDELRDAARTACDALAESTTRWIAVGVGRQTGWLPASASGTYVGFGADVVVGLSPATGSDSATEVDPSMELSALTIGLMREQSAPSRTVPVAVIAVDATAEDCAALAADVSTRIADSSETVGLLVVGDGATTLTAKAPGSFDDRAEAAQSAIDDALALGDTGALASLDGTLCRELGISGRAVWQVAAAIVGASPVQARSLYRGAPYGVGYHVATWEL